MTAGELHDLIVASLTRKLGGSRRRWRLAVGPVRVYSLSTHPHCNWSVAPSGLIGDIAEIETLLDSIRAQHPVITGD